MRERSTSDGDDPFASPRRGEHLVIWTLWFTYGCFYFCRQNLSTVIKAIESPVESGGLGLASEQVGWILASAKIAYGLGQLLNGQLSERFPPRVMLAIGMFGSAALNVAFGLSEGFYFLLFVWATNGFCQSLGWSPCVRVAANWVPIERRGKAIGIIGTGYQITQGLTYIVAGQAAARLGWRGALYVPAVMLATAGVFMLIFLRDRPAAEERESTSRESESVRRASLPFAESLYWTLFNPALWLLGLALGLLNACRYGFLDWGVKHLMTTRDLKVDKATLQFFWIAIGATAGSYLAGWATDRFFGGRRAPVVCVLMALLGGLALLYDSPVTETPAGLMGLLVVIGFCIFGPQVLLVGTAPADLAHKGTSAAAAGFVNFMGYMGAATGDVVTGYLSAGEGGWETAITTWAVWAFAGSAVTALLWNTTSHKLKLIPDWTPKLGGIVTLGTASAALYYGDQPLILSIVTGIGLVCLFGTFVTRWLAAPAFGAAVLGVLLVFLSLIQTRSGATWPQTLGLVSFGLTAVLTLMILVEQRHEAAEN